MVCKAVKFGGQCRCITNCLLVKCNTETSGDSRRGIINPCLSPLVRFGTSTWTYEGWQGRFHAFVLRRLAGLQCLHARETTLHRIQLPFTERIHSNGLNNGLP